jgi:hypothetical protein
MEARNAGIARWPRKIGDRRRSVRRGRIEPTATENTILKTANDILKKVAVIFGTKTQLHVGK